MRFSRSFAALTVLPLTAVAHAETSVFVEGHTLSYSESAALLSIDKFDTGFDPSGDLSLSYSKVTTGAQYGRFDFGIFARADGIAEYTEDTAEIYREISNSLPISRGEYDIDLTADHFIAYGLRAGYTHPFRDDLSITVHANYLSAFEMTQGTLQGVFIADDAVQSEFELDYFYSRELFGLPFFQDMKPDKPTGTGYSLDISGQWTPHERLLFEFDIDDLWGEINWEDNPRSDATLDVTVDPETAEVSPVFRYAHTTENHTQSIEPRGSASVQFDATQKISVMTEIDRAPSATFFVAGGDYQLTESVRLGARFEAVTGAYGVSAKLWGLDLDIVADSFNPENTKFARINASYRHTF